MKFAIVQQTNLTQEQTNWINDLSIELKLFFEGKYYGKDLNELYLGLIMVKPEFDQFFKKKRPRYRPGVRTSFVDGIEIISRNCAEIDCKIDFVQVVDLKKEELIKKVGETIILESVCLTRLSKLNEFDFELFKTDLENYLLDKKYISSH